MLQKLVRRLQGNIRPSYEACVLRLATLGQPSFVCARLHR